jgi:chlorite dismutase
MSEPTQTIEGWYAYHEFRTIDWALWKTVSDVQRDEAIQEYASYETQQLAVGSRREGSYSLYQMAGDKADLLFLYLRPSLTDLLTCKNAFNKTSLADFTIPSYSYTSVVELSSYLSQPGSNPMEDPTLQPRLMPDLRTMPSHVCFYPMNKRRVGHDNWYMLNKPERVTMMRSHGQIGKEYADRVTQIITGSVGLDDWEWGVTLFADDPLFFKKLVYEMRFDEVSARYGEFGPFYVGKTITGADLQHSLAL